MLKIPPFRVRWVLLVLLVFSGCAGVRHEVLAPLRLPAPQGVIFSADGAGGFEATSDALRQSIQTEGLPLHVETVDWSHGFGRIISDEVGRGRMHEAADCLAAKVAAFHSSCPDTPIYFLGHSAGSAVVLGAAERLPTGCVDRIVLLAPSVSAEYDLRPALRCVREEIDVFTSKRDWWYLGFGVSIVGTADGRWRAAAGRVGFRPIIQAPEDASLYTKLRQHPWDACVEWTGNRGGHYGSHHPEFLRAYVLPLMTCRGRVVQGPASAP
ncbi:MAG TPA: alpha/beta hydrolase [Gemmataceae bacterium]|nr:alpha/beta hydrolase [Gemmataceae bacterium]